MNVIALDIGGTKIYAARYNAKLEIEAETRVPTQGHQVQSVICQNILQAIKEVQNKETKAVGISWAGFVDNQNGIILKAPNIPSLNNFKITNFVTQETGLKCFLENDARCFALGQQSQCFPNSKVCIGIIMGTGVGSGIVINGIPFSGSQGSAGEIGHIQDEGIEIEAQLAGPGLEKLLKVKHLSELDSDMPSIKTDIKKLIDPRLKIFSNWLSSVVLTFDPDQIVIGGGAGKYFWNHYQEEITILTNQQLEPYPVSLTLNFSTLKNAGADGAAALAFKKLSNLV